MSLHVTPSQPSLRHRARCHRTPRLMALVPLVLLLVPAAFMGPTAAIAAQSPSGPVTAASAELPTVMRSLAVGQSLAIHQVPLGLSKSGSTLEVERFQAVTPDARVMIHGDSGTEMIPAPDNVYLKGRISGQPRSRVFLSSLDQGGVRGVVTVEGRYWILAGAGTGGGPVVGLTTREIDVATEFASEVSSFECAVDRLASSGLDLDDPDDAASAARALLDDTFGVNPATAQLAGGGPSNTARIAIETDFEYFQLMGSDIDDAIDYATDLIAFASTIYEDELDTTLLMDYISLWTTSSDPWTQNSTFCGLMESGRYWNDNRSTVDRTLMHFLSGKSSGGGIAWVGVLCSGSFNFNHGGNCPALSPQNDNYGGDYGLSGALNGNFDINNPSVIWDIVVVSHEIGHNFNSPHTHCYQGLGGNAASVDNCNAGQCGEGGCYCGGTSLPCAGGTGCGTIMSYCHLLGGGLSNIALTLGRGHPHGVAPERVPDRMSSHVTSRAGSNPGCLDVAEDAVFADSFDFGIGTWSGSEDNASRLATNGSAALAPGSTQGLEISVTGDDQTRAFVVDESPSGDHRYRLRFYFDPNSIVMDDNKRHKIATLFSESPSTRRLMTLVFRNDPASDYRLLAKSHLDDGSWAKTEWIDLTDAPHVIEVEWLKSGGTNTSNGYLRLWIDGTLVGTVTGIENDGWDADYLRFGFVGGLDENTSGSSFFDAVVVQRQSYIGPL